MFPSSETRMTGSTTITSYRRWDGRRCAGEGDGFWISRFSLGSIGGGGYLSIFVSSLLPRVKSTEKC